MRAQLTTQPTMRFRGLSHPIPNTSITLNRQVLAKAAVTTADTIDNTEAAAVASCPSSHLFSGISI